MIGVGRIAACFVFGATLLGTASAQELRLNQIQMVGTAESYKQAPSVEMLSLIRMGGKKAVQALDFSSPALAAQLDAGARALSFDIYNDPNGGLFKNPSGASMASQLLEENFVAAMTKPGMKVIHVPDVDFNSSCLALKDCLSEIAAWSGAHPGHGPVVILLHAHDTKTPIPGAAKPLPFDAAAVTALTREIASSIPAAAILSPAALKDGKWPTLSEARGKLLFVLDGAPASGLLFAANSDARSDAGFVLIDNPKRDAARITAAVRAGKIVITRADEDTAEARKRDTSRAAQAFAAGAQIVRTNFLLPDAKIGAYRVAIPDAGHVRCNAVTASCGRAKPQAVSLRTAGR